jgi:very-short-patch-repair endonuclease
VNRQSWITRVSIDFYVKTLDLYVEFDGVFHHGLAKRSDHEREIVKKKLVRDKKVNDWFTENSKNFKLFRLSDVQWNNVVKVK